MKKRILCLVLSLVLALTLAAVPAGAVSYGSYADVVKAAIAENGTGASGYGMLYDLDSDGTDELLMLFRSAGVRVVLSVYTLSDGSSKALLDHVPVYQEVGSTTGAVSVVTKDGATMLLAEHSSAEEDGDLRRVTGSDTLYALQGGAITETSAVDYKYTETASGVLVPETFNASERTSAGSAAFTLEQFQARQNAMTRHTLLVARDLHDRGDGLPLEMLLGRLQGRIGPFTDVPANEWYADSVEWALLHEVTNGTSPTTFDPNGTCTRAQMVTFLWRAHGSPKLKEAGGTPFTDVPQSEYYYDAVRWAVTRGITNGMTETTFCPEAKLTRGQTVTFLWRDACHPSAEIPNFKDVAQNEYYADAVGWAQERGVTNGMTPTTFEPDGNCTRAQIVTFISRAMCAPGLHAADVTGLVYEKSLDYATDDYGKEILFTSVGDVDDFSVTRLMLTATNGLVPDTTAHAVGTLHDGDSFLLRTGIPDVAARYGVTYTIGDRTVTLAIMDSGRDGSLYLTEL